MLLRTLEPEVMDTRTEAVDYDAMDHGEVNRVFVDDFLAAVRQAGLEPRLRNGRFPLRVLDCGTGTAQIPLELCRRTAHCRVTAVDLAREMLRVAEQNVRQAGLERRILLEHVDAKRLPYPRHGFDAVMSNSIVHHIPQPAEVLGEMVRVLRPGGVLFVRDLVRAGDLATVDRLVETYAGQANEHQRQMFRDSLCAALTLDEVRSLLSPLGLPAEWVTQTTDRHWTLLGVLSG